MHIIHISSEHDANVPEGVMAGRVQKPTSPTKRTLQRSSTFVKTESSQASSNGALQTPALTPGSTSDVVDVSFAEDDFAGSFDFDEAGVQSFLGTAHDLSFRSIGTDSF